MTEFKSAENRIQETKPVVLLIPALDPEERLLSLLRELKEVWHDPILLVDDGSGEKARREIFPAAEALGAVVVHHACNLGKGRALKTGFNECLCRFPDAIGVVTADADGQHLASDIAACRDRLRERPDALVLGCRDFSGADVPPKSEFGNRITRAFMRFLCGVSVSDTQTGLRAIPAPFMRRLLSVSGERFEFETNMLLETRTAHVPMIEQPIATVYHAQNRATHFNPLTDSLRIYALLLKFCGASLVGFAVDIAAFALFSHLLRALPLGHLTITAATVLARILSAAVNYALNHRIVFRSSKKAGGTAFRYTLLCIVQMLASAGLVTLFFTLLGGSAVVWKIIVDFLLFFISFQIQRRFVF